MVSGRLPRRQVGMVRLSVLTAASCVDEKVKYSVPVTSLILFIKAENVDYEVDESLAFTFDSISQHCVSSKEQLRGVRTSFA